jgi:hypothetical protein
VASRGTVACERDEELGPGVREAFLVHRHARLRERRVGRPHVSLAERAERIEMRRRRRRVPTRLMDPGRHAVEDRTEPFLLGIALDRSQRHVQGAVHVAARDKELDEPHLREVAIRAERERALEIVYRTGAAERGSRDAARETRATFDAGILVGTRELDHRVEEAEVRRQHALREPRVVGSIAHHREPFDRASEEPRDEPIHRRQRLHEGSLDRRLPTRAVMEHAHRSRGRAERGGDLVDVEIHPVAQQQHRDPRRRSAGRARRAATWGCARTEDHPSPRALRPPADPRSVRDAAARPSPDSRDGHEPWRDRRARVAWRLRESAQERLLHDVVRIRGPHEARRDRGQHALVLEEVHPAPAL